MIESMFTWQPLTQNVLSHLPKICSEDVEEWIVNAPLVCFEIVEWHQFGWHPVIPVLCETCEKLHRYDCRGKEKVYATLHRLNIERWMNRKRYLVPPGAPYNSFISYPDPYVIWYRSITRLLISPQSKDVQGNYKSQHYYYPTAADYYLLLAEMYMRQLDGMCVHSKCFVGKAVREACGFYINYGCILFSKYK